MRIETHTIIDYVINMVGYNGLLSINFKNDLIDLIGPNKNSVSNKLSYLLQNNYLSKNKSEAGFVYRLTKKGEKLLLRSNEDIYNIYMENYAGKKIPYTQSIKIRYSLSSELVQRMFSVGITVNDNIITLITDNNSQIECNSYYYTSRFFKNNSYDSYTIQRINISRFIGTLITQKDVFIVYNFITPKSKWSISSELMCQITIANMVNEKNKVEKLEDKKMKLLIGIRSQDEVLEYILNYNERTKNNQKSKYKKEEPKRRTINPLLCTEEVYMLPIKETESCYTLLAISENLIDEVLIEIIGYEAIELAKKTRVEFAHGLIVNPARRFIQVLDNKLITFKNLLDMSWLYQGEEQTVVICFPYQINILKKIREELIKNQLNVKPFFIYSKNTIEITKKALEKQNKQNM